MRPDAATASAPAAVTGPAAAPSAVATWDAASAPATGSGARTTAPRTATVVPAPDRKPAHTPSRLRAASALAALAGVVLAIFGAWTLQARATALAAATADAEQLTRLQQIETSLAGAEAAVSNAFLQGGLEPAAARQAYDDAIADATGLIARAAAAQPADAEALEVLNQRLARYVGLVEQARSNNRQLLPLGSGYLNAASTSLRSDLGPVLDVLVDTTNDRLDGEFESAGRHLATFLLLAAAVVTALVVLAIWHARRFRRLLNVPLTIAAAAAVVAGVAGTAALVAADSRASDTRDGALAVALAASDARAAGFDAKAQESLGLVNRGQGAGSFETQWKQAAERATAQLASTGTEAAAIRLAWSGYANGHAAIRAEDDKGQWERAVALAVATGPTSANAEFADFADRTRAVAEQSSSKASRDLDGAGGPLPWAAVAVVLLGLVVAAGGVAGFAQRLREYQ